MQKKKYLVLDMIFNCDEKSICKYSCFLRNGLLLDTSVLMIYFLGEYDYKNNTNYLKQWTNDGIPYSELDYQSLKRFIDRASFSKLYITPHIFHEFYKHAQKILKENLDPFFKNSMEKLIRINEENVDKNDILAHKYFDKLEIGEHSLYILKESIHSAILTDDERKTIPLFCEDKKLLLIPIREAIKFTLNS